jgi:hypothetical protein
MTPNIGEIERIFRIALGFMLMLLAATGRVGGWGWIGVLPFITGLISLCPLYGLLRWARQSATAGQG